MRVNNEELITELKIRLSSEKSLKKKFLLKKAIDAINELNQ
jgi:hypothetical protein